MEGAVRAHNDLVAACSARGRASCGTWATAIRVPVGPRGRERGDRHPAAAPGRWPEVGELRVRIGLNTGWCHVVDGEVFGRPPNLAARLEAAAHGSQILVSDTTAQACAGALDPGMQLFNLGRYHIRGFDHPVVVHAVVADGLQGRVPRCARRSGASTSCHPTTTRSTASARWSSWCPGSSASGGW